MFGLQVVPPSFEYAKGFAAKVGGAAPTARNVIAWGNAPGERQSEI